jgi:peptidylprolyl isomerase
VTALGARRLLPLAAAALLALTGCGESGEDVVVDTPPQASASADGDTGSAQACPGPTPVPAPEGATTDLSTKPAVEVGEDPAPSTLEVSDIVVGEGEVACPGDTVLMQYVGVTYADGQQFDASWDRGEPFPFRLGAGQVIAGWDEGIVGMREGGRRQLVIPPDLGYGDRGAGADIPPGATLVFVVDLLEVQS